MADRHFSTAPPTPWTRLLSKRNRGLSDGEALPGERWSLDSGDRAAVQRYAALCGLPRTELVPLCWPHVLAGALHLQMIADPKFPLSGLGMVHVANRIVQRRPIRLDERFVVRCAWTGWRRVKQGAELSLHTTVEIGDERPWEGESAFLSRAVRGQGQASRSDAPPLETVRRSTTWRLPADQGRRYAAVSGDYNLIHIHPIPAKMFGFQRAIVHGMWALARGLAELDAPPGPCTLDVDFRRPILLPSTVLFQSDDQGRFEVRQVKGRKLSLAGRLVAGVDATD